MNNPSKKVNECCEKCLEIVISKSVIGDAGTTYCGDPACPCHKPEPWERVIYREAPNAETAADIVRKLKLPLKNLLATARKEAVQETYELLTTARKEAEDEAVDLCKRHYNGQALIEHERMAIDKTVSCDEHYERGKKEARLAFREEIIEIIKNLSPLTSGDIGGRFRAGFEAGKKEAIAKIENLNDKTSEGRQDI